MPNGNGLFTFAPAGVMAYVSGVVATMEEPFTRPTTNPSSACSCTVNDPDVTLGGSVVGMRVTVTVTDALSWDPSMPASTTRTVRLYEPGYTKLGFVLSTTESAPDALLIANVPSLPAVIENVSLSPMPSAVSRSVTYEDSGEPTADTSVCAGVVKAGGVVVHAGARFT